MQSRPRQVNLSDLLLYSWRESIEDYVDRFLDFSFRVKILPDQICPSERSETRGPQTLEVEQTSELLLGIPWTWICMCRARNSFSLTCRPYSGPPRQVNTDRTDPSPRRFSSEQHESHRGRRHCPGERETPERRPRDQVRYEADLRAQN